MCTISDIHDSAFLETSIKYYKVNENSFFSDIVDVSLYMVFVALATEKVYLPFDNEGNILTIQYGDSVVTPLFSSITRCGNYSDCVSLCCVKNYVNMLLEQRRHLVINPFSESNIQLFLSHDCIEKILIPVIRNGAPSCK